MATRTAFCALMFTSLLLSSSAGCLALITSREFLEELRDAPKSEEMTQKYSLNNTFTGITPSAYYDSEEIIINDTVSVLKIYFRASMAFADQTENLPVNNVRYVNARLLEADGTVFWSVNATNTTRPPESREFKPFNSGTWTLEVDARGYGADLIIQEFYDNFLIEITVVRDCTTYPPIVPEVECTFD